MPSSPDTPHNTAMAALLSLVGLLYTFDTLLQFLSGLALTWCGLGLLGGDDQVGVVLPFRSLMATRRARASPRQYELGDPPAETMISNRALHRYHLPHTTALLLTVLRSLSYLHTSHTPLILSPHTHHRRQLGGLDRDVAGDSGVDLLVPGCAMWFSLIMWGTCVVFIPSKLTAHDPKPLAPPLPLPTFRSL